MEEELGLQLPTNSWMVRPCEVYKEEYKDCNSFRGRFHQYFIHGEVSSEKCAQWKTDFDNCMKWRKSKQLDALSSVVDSELYRRRIRVKGTVANDTFLLRTEPLPDSEWNKPLPEYITKDYETSILEAMKKKQVPNDNNETWGTQLQRCNVM